MTVFYLIIIAISVFLLSAGGLKLALYLLPKLNAIDVPNERSNHVRPTPRGGGIAVMFAVLSFLIVCVGHGSIIFSVLLLAAVSFADDIKPVPAVWRFIAQLYAVGLAITSVDGLVFQGLLPWYLDMFCVAMLWLWFINMYNFMDGIDGITANQSITNCLGFILLYVTTRDQSPHIPLDVATDSVIIASAMLAFLLYNKPPARIFLGDTGSIPLGFLMGYLSFTVAASGYWAAALILPAYYVTDGTLTLFRRVMKGKKIWEAHSEHAYQRAVRAGRSHGEVVRHLFGTNLIYIVLALVSTLDLTSSLICTALAYIFAWFMMHHLTSYTRRAHAVVA